MSLYNMLFGKNQQTDLLLAVLGLRPNDVERLRDVHVTEEGKRIEVLTRTGGGNRGDYLNLAMRHAPGWLASVDDDFDSTYCTDVFIVPDEFVADVATLHDILKHGLRPEFGQHIAKTLLREPTEKDLEDSQYQSEASALAATDHFMANGHTFVPRDDAAMRVALDLAEKNGGKLRSCWGIRPLEITVCRNQERFPMAPKVRDRSYSRVRVHYEWKIDEEYLAHCVEVFSSEFPVAMAGVG